VVRDHDDYDQVIWISDIPRYNGCYTKVWELIGQPAEAHSDHWIEIAKPRLTAPPELPDSLDRFVIENEWRDSSNERPSLLEISREQLIRHFLHDKDIEPEFENHSINDNEDVSAAYVKYINTAWKPWAEIKRIEHGNTPFPEPPEPLAPWLDEILLHNHNLDEPPLKEEISVEVDTKFREAKVKLEKDWQQYLDSKWHPWAEQDRKLQKIQKIYNQLYSAYQRRQKLGEQYEVVLGFGLLSWTGPMSRRVRRHVLTVEATIEFDARNGVIATHAAPNGSVITVEDDMLHTEERPQPSEKTKIDTQAKEAAGEFWDQAVVGGLATSFVNALQYQTGTGLQNNGKFELSLDRPTTASQMPVIHLAPALILRKRSQRGFIRLLEEIENEIDRGGEIPGGIKTIIHHAGNEAEEDGLEVAGVDIPGALTGQEIYFPLPANKEQRQIVDYLNRGRGVRVQGPPGTGKSHTITNLICHLLASGKRVLVTSETERALRSLRSKFVGAAERLSDLAVILLGNDATSLRELEKSVAAISSKKEHWNRADSAKAIAKYEKKLQEVRESKRLAENDLRSLREADVYKHENKFDTYSGTLQEIAQVINDQSIEFSWLNEVPRDGIFGHDILRIDARNFVGFWHQWKLADKIDEQQPTIATDQLPTSDQLREVIEQFNKLTQESDALRQKSDLELLETVKTLPSESILSIYQSAELILVGLRGHVTTALRFAREGKKVKKSLFNKGEYKAALKGLEKISLDGHLLSSLEALEKLDCWLDVKDALNTLSSNWRGITPISPASMKRQIAKYGELLEPLEQALGLHQQVQACQKEVDQLAKFTAPQWHIYENLERFCSTFELCNHEAQLKDINSKLDQYAAIARIADSAANENNGLLERAIITHNCSAYQIALDKIKASNKLHKNQNIILSCARSLRSHLPETYSQFARSDDIDVWIQRLSRLQDALQWVRASDWVRKLTDPKAAQSINADVEIHANNERDLLGKIAEEKSWAHCINRLGESQRQALVAWLHAIERVGRGAGRHAENHRRTARQKLQECQTAIPAWVMPLHRVVETVDAKPEIFDVAIIDEASQSGSEALILNYIAKKVIVVGDDKQIRPQNIGVNHDQVEYLRNLYLGDFPHSDMFDLKSSYFSQAAVRFPSQVSLKEHFRCMPEIIQFSNQHFYQAAPLIPLKQFGSNRLDPVVTEYVESGYRIGTSRNVHNEPEARRLVEKLAKCCSDPAYHGKSFGVITLLGHAQAILIEELLLNEIGPSKYEERKILVGSAYAFQGDERDIIFISMVDAPPESGMCRRETRVEKEREFNVAASRAMEQMILFHSMTKNELHQDCLKYKLLNHCSNPSVEQLPVGDITLNELREVVHRTKRSRDTQPSPFESWFEVDVFLELANRGYQILPQYKVNPNDNTYRIDMIVMGMNGKLAIECDGDHWHGPAEYESDMARQRELERCGWEFWRVRGGAYYREPKTAMESLWKLLDKRGIFSKDYQPPKKIDAAHERKIIVEGDHIELE
jgi:very-short-patch-repair endonuclease